MHITKRDWRRTTQFDRSLSTEHPQCNSTRATVECSRVQANLPLHVIMNSRVRTFFYDDHIATLHMFHTEECRARVRGFALWDHTCATRSLIVPSQTRLSSHLFGSAVLAVLVKLLCIFSLWPWLVAPVIGSQTPSCNNSAIDFCVDHLLFWLDVSRCSQRRHSKDALLA